MPGKLKLTKLRRPLEDIRGMSATEKKQLTKLLRGEGTTIAKAAADEEMTMELVDVVDDEGAERYQLYLWPAGSGALMAAGTTEVVASIAQHAFELVAPDPALHEEIAAAWKAGAAKLEIQETVEFSSPRPATRAAPASGAQLPPLATADASGLHAWKLALFPRSKQWQTYPKRKPSELDDDQRLFIEKALAAGVSVDLEHHGLFLRHADLLRFIGVAPQGPSDVAVTVGADTLPLWCAVSRVASGHLPPAPVLAAFRNLPPAQALAAWSEIAGGRAYDVHEARPTSMPESNKPRTKLKQAHSTRLFHWMSDACVALGAPGRDAAVAVLDELPQYYFSAPLHIGALSLVRHAAAGHGAFPARFEPLLARTDPNTTGATEFSDAVRDEILRSRG